MAEEDSIFDTFMQKKKKKKKTTFDLEAALAGDGSESASGATTDTPNATTQADEGDAGDDQGGVKAAPAGQESWQQFSGQDDGAEQEEDFDLDMDFSMKKKKKKTKKKLDDLMVEEDERADDKENGKKGGGEFGGWIKHNSIAFTCLTDLDGSISESVEDANSSWAGSDRDYTYDELLKRVFEIILDKNPEMAAGRKPKFVMRPPQVLRVGTKKTSFANFMEICKVLHRLPKHLLDYLLSELGTSGSVDGNNQLIIKGRFQPKQIENVLRRYIKEYVTCHTCKSPDTILQKDTRLFFLQCESCGSRCSVASIKSGFQAVTSKRAAIRAKTA
ncbi:eukaryotic translation initiation factor 2 subunit 2 isoform X1 [Phlebotomus argentipes]|uniref:eukaryotic translation initiation factor 2 subunit 2 isoform X1 n=1 Tax=Phlebotomus argentipes TaxID=94469 RepID=UPI00289314DF|nr:eukaryotic translation initiation factor 2 subunit 2 isoform X1 [Phlebotomus argentipes]